MGWVGLDWVGPGWAGWVGLAWVGLAGCLAGWPVWLAGQLAGWLGWSGWQAGLLAGKRGEVSRKSSLELEPLEEDDDAQQCSPTHAAPPAALRRAALCLPSPSPPLLFLPPSTSPSSLPSIPLSLLTLVRHAQTNPLVCGAFLRRSQGKCMAIDMRAPSINYGSWFWPVVGMMG